MKELKILNLGPYTIPEIGAVRVEYGITFKEVPVVIPLTAWKSQNEIYNPIAQEITNSYCWVDYVNGGIVGQINVYVIGYI